ncbi:MAG: ComF family protein [Alphaproteobacteria bacterium]|nr:ComF family protein [Alphaproteobacteria bacterium]
MTTTDTSLDAAATPPESVPEPADVRDPALDAARRSSSPPVSGLVASFRNWLTDLLMPPVCLACQEAIASRDALCPDCWRGVDFIGPPLCDRLGIRLPYSTGGIMISAAAAARPPPYARARAVAHYEGAMRKLVHGLKFRDRHEVRSLFGTWLCRAGRDLIEDADVIVPVPLSRSRLLQRRFNQSAILAQEVARITGLPVHTTALHRTRRTQRQVGLSREQRRDNVRGAFEVPRRQLGKIQGRRVLLIDDVITTGATAEACTTTLLKAGATDVDVLAVAIVADPLRITT